MFGTGMPWAANHPTATLAKHSVVPCERVTPVPVVATDRLDNPLKRAEGFPVWHKAMSTCERCAQTWLCGRQAPIEAIWLRELFQRVGRPRIAQQVQANPVRHGLRDV